MKHIVTELNRHEKRNGFHILVGGAPITKEFASQIGADGFAADAASATVLAKSFVS